MSQWLRLRSVRFQCVLVNGTHWYTLTAHMSRKYVVDKYKMQSKVKPTQAQFLVRSQKVAKPTNLNELASLGKGAGKSKVKWLEKFFSMVKQTMITVFQA